ncbi:MAG: N-acetylneuraminate synthase [Syntrophales bacterium]|nr:N-acetylneuraminate synthase [Syntrophales bacterium]
MIWTMMPDRTKGQVPVFIIAEAGVNHNGDIDLAKRLIDVATEAGADAVKFQTFQADKVMSRHAPKAEYQKTATQIDETQLEMVRNLELDEEAHRLLIDHCRWRGIQFLSTPFDLESIDLLTKIFDLPCLKIGSGEITNGPFLLKVAQTGRPVILSTGMSMLSEIEDALGVLAFGYTRVEETPSQKGFLDAFCSEQGQRVLREKVRLLHCTTEYPAPFEEVNLAALTTIWRAFGLPVGLSDHTPGIAVPVAAVALGASIIEKHFTLDKAFPGPDHRASLTPYELKEMVIAIRQIEAAMGNPMKFPTPSEIKNRDVARKSLMVARPIHEGEAYTTDNITTKRPGTGISPMRYWEFLGRKSNKDYTEDELVAE